jgi:hypothetical protein
MLFFIIAAEGVFLAVLRAFFRLFGAALRFVALLFVERLAVLLLAVLFFAFLFFAILFPPNLCWTFQTHIVIIKFFVQHI